MRVEGGGGREREGGRESEGWGRGRVGGWRRTDRFDPGQVCFSCVTGANGDVRKKERKMHRNRIRVSNVSPAVLAKL